MRSVRSEWYIARNNDRCTASIDDFLCRLKKPGRDYFELSFYKKNPQDTKIAVVEIEIDKTSQSEYSTTFLFGSNSKNEDIYNNFKNLGLEEKLLIAFGDYGKDNWITLKTREFSNPAEVSPYIQLCNEYDSTIPIEILNDLKTACGIPLIPSKKEFEEMIHENGYKYALKQADSCSNKDLYIISLADALFENHKYEDAGKCYELITKQDMDLYKKAQYQLGSMIFNFTDTADYDSPRDHARASLQHYAEADDYLDCNDLSKRIFNCLCTGSYNLANCLVPYPSGARAEGIFELGDYIYSIHKKANLYIVNPIPLHEEVYSVWDCKQTLFDKRNDGEVAVNLRNAEPKEKKLDTSSESTMSDDTSKYLLSGMLTNCIEKGYVTVQELDDMNINMPWIVLALQCFNINKAVCDNSITIDQLKKLTSDQISGIQFKLTGEALKEEVEKFVRSNMECFKNTRGTRP